MQKHFQYKSQQKREHNPKLNKLIIDNPVEFPSLAPITKAGSSNTVWNEASTKKLRVAGENITNNAMKKKVDSDVDNYKNYRQPKLSVLNVYHSDDDNNYDDEISYY